MFQALLGQAELDETWGVSVGCPRCTWYGRRSTDVDVLESPEAKLVALNVFGAVHRELATHVIQWRRKYLRQIRELRRPGRPIFYTDETWVNVGHTTNRVWVDDSVKTAAQAKRGGLSVSLQNPSGKGTRLIVTHCGNEHGFVQGAEVFQAKRAQETTIEIRAGLYLSPPDRFLFSPTEEEEESLNPIELIWSDTKRSVAFTIQVYKLKELKKLIADALSQASAQKWKNYVKHVIDEEDKMKEMDHILDEFIDNQQPVVVSLGDDTSSDEDASMN
ncbi:hypothetical protein HPB49_008273 [Dermacentor silvarum]|uniref:Uncharacterized protein n=1 Tax=Dermacentor silvarum TaxID=543639 RepID=A0ACB8DN95_DERSI|nr:hypothetical protein HPB49_008273 [Dermacentor silvarum]